MKGTNAFESSHHDRDRAAVAAKDDAARRRRVGRGTGSCGRPPGGRTHSISPTRVSTKETYQLNCSGQDLTKEDFTGENRKDLSEGNFANANFKGQHLSHVRFNDADLAGADLRGVTFEDSSLYRANLTGAKLEDARLINNSLIVGADVTDTVMMPPEKWTHWPVTPEMLKDSTHAITGTRVTDCQELTTRIPKPQFDRGSFVIGCKFIGKPDDAHGDAYGSKKIRVGAPDDPHGDRE
jgi:hypothetical protein